MEPTIAPIDLLGPIARYAPLTLLDLRRADDRAEDPAATPGAHWLDPVAIATWGADPDPEREIVLYCVRGGSVSDSVLDALRDRGLKAPYIEGGLKAWKAAGGALETPA